MYTYIQTCKYIYVCAYAMRRLLVDSRSCVRDLAMKADAAAGFVSGGQLAAGMVEATPPN